MRSTKRIFIVTLAICLLAPMLMAGIVNANALPSKTLVAQQQAGTVTAVNEPTGSAPSAGTWTGGSTYVVSSNQTLETVTVNGNVTVWIKEGVTLTINGEAGTSYGDDRTTNTSAENGVNGKTALTINNGAKLTVEGPGNFVVKGGAGGRGQGYANTGPRASVSTVGFSGGAGGIGGTAIVNNGTLEFGARLSGAVVIEGGAGGAGATGQRGHDRADYSINTYYGYYGSQNSHAATGEIEAGNWKGGTGGNGGNGGVAISGSGKVEYNQDNGNANLGKNGNIATGTVNIKGGLGGNAGNGGAAGNSTVTIGTQAVAYSGNNYYIYYPIYFYTTAEGNGGTGGDGGIGVTNNTLEFNTGVATIEGGNGGAAGGTGGFNNREVGLSVPYTLYVYYNNGTTSGYIPSPGSVTCKSYESGTAGYIGSGNLGVSGTTIENNGGTNYITGGYSYNGAQYTAASSSVTADGNQTGSLYIGYASDSIAGGDQVKNFRALYLEGYDNFATSAKNFYVLNKGDNWTDADGTPHVSDGLTIGGTPVETRDVFISPQGYLYLTTSLSGKVEFDVAVNSTLQGTMGTYPKEVRLSKAGAGVYHFSGDTSSSTAEARYAVGYATDADLAKSPDSAFDVHWLQGVNFTSPINISTAPQLAAVAWAVNNGVSGAAEAIYNLTSNIDLGSFNWTPIGTKTHPFKGTFNGNNKTILNMRVNEIDGIDSYGLFGVTVGTETKPVVIKDFTLTRDTFTHTRYKTFFNNRGASGGNFDNNSGGTYNNIEYNIVDVTRSGDIYAGAAIGHATDTNVSNVTANYLDVIAEGTDATKEAAVGGIVGYAVKNGETRGTFVNLTANGGSQPYQSQVSNSGLAYAKGEFKASYVGGAVGYLKNIDLKNTSLTNMAPKADKTTDGVWIGGLAGYVEKSDIKTGTVTASQAEATPYTYKTYAVSTINKQAYAGGAVGQGTEVSIDGITVSNVNTITATSDKLQSYAGGIVGYVVGVENVTGASVLKAVQNNTTNHDANTNIIATAGSNSNMDAFAGGLLGYAKEVYTTNNKMFNNSGAAQVNNIKAVSTTDNAYAGGLIGYIKDTIAHNSAVNNSSAFRVSVIAAGNVGGSAKSNNKSYAGGGVGFIEIKDGTVIDKLSISGTGSQAAPIIAYGTDATYAAGAVAYAPEIVITNTTVAQLNDVKALSHQDEGYAGGLAGYLTAINNGSLADIKGNVVSGSGMATNILASSTKGAGSNKDAYAGGLLGYAKDVMLSASNMYAGNSGTSASNNIKASAPQGFAYAGGLIGKLENDIATEMAISTAGVNYTSVIAVGSEADNTTPVPKQAFAGGAVGDLDVKSWTTLDKIYILDSGNSIIAKAKENAYAGGIAGFAPEAQINTIEITGIDNYIAESTDETGYAGGLAGHLTGIISGAGATRAEIFNITIQGTAATTIKASSSATSAMDAYAGGFIGLAEEVFLSEGTKKSVYSGHNGSGEGNAIKAFSPTKNAYAGGVFGILINRIDTPNAITNAEASYTSVIAAGLNENSDAKLKAFAGGMVGWLDVKSWTELNTLTVTDASNSIKAKATKEAYAGGIVGFAPEAQIYNVAIAGVDNYIAESTDETGYAGGLAGHLTGIKSGSSTGNAKLAEIYNVTIEGKKATTMRASSSATGDKDAYAGGFIGLAEEVYLKDFTTQSKYSGHSGSGAGNTIMAFAPSSNAYAGGIFGILINKIDTPKAITKAEASYTSVIAAGGGVSDAYTKASKEAYAGGMVGKLAVDSWTDLIALNVTDSNNSIEAYGTGVAYAGGIAGYAPETLINTATISGINKYIAESTNETGYAGGLAGFLTGNAGKLSDVKGITISNTAATVVKAASSASAVKDAFAGGLIGLAQEVVLSNNTYSGGASAGSEVQAFAPTGNAYAGGLVGILENATRTPITPNAIAGSTVRNTSVIAAGSENGASRAAKKAYAGGIVGELAVVDWTELKGLTFAASGNSIRSFSVDTAYTGGIAGHADETEINTSSITGIDNYIADSSSDIGYAGGIAGYLTGIKTKVSVLNNNTIAGTGSGAVTVKAKSGNGTNDKNAYAGGLVGYAQEVTVYRNQFLADANSGSNKVIAVAPNGTAYSGGFLGHIINSGVSKVSITDSTVRKVSVLAGGNEDATSSAINEAYAGGVVGKVESAAGTELVNIAVSGGDVSVKANAVNDAYAARMVGYAPNANIVNGSFNNHLSSAYVNVSATSSSKNAYSAAVAGKLVGSGAISSTSASMINIVADANSTAWAGGLLGYADNCTIAGSDVNRYVPGDEVFYNSTLSVTKANKTYAGGIAGEIVNTNKLNSSNESTYIMNNAVSVTMTLPTSNVHAGGLYGKVNDALIGSSYARDYSINGNSENFTNSLVAGVVGELRDSELIAVYGVGKNGNQINSYPGMYHTGGNNKFYGSYVLHGSFSPTADRDKNTYLNTYYVGNGDLDAIPEEVQSVTDAEPYYTKGSNGLYDLLSRYDGKTYKYSTLMGVKLEYFDDYEVNASMAHLIHFFNSHNSGAITTQYEQRLGITLLYNMLGSGVSGNFTYPRVAPPVGFTLSVLPGTDYGHIKENEAGKNENSTFTELVTKVFTSKTKLVFTAEEEKTLPRDLYFFAFKDWTLKATKSLFSWDWNGSTQVDNPSPFNTSNDDRLKDSVIRIIMPEGSVSLTANFEQRDNRIRGAINEAIGEAMKASLTTENIATVQALIDADKNEEATNFILDTMFKNKAAMDAYYQVFKEQVTDTGAGSNEPAFPVVYPNGNKNLYNALTDKDMIAKQILKDAIAKVVESDSFSAGSHTEAITAFDKKCDYVDIGTDMFSSASNFNKYVSSQYSFENSNKTQIGIKSANVMDIVIDTLFNGTGNPAVATPTSNDRYGHGTVGGVYVSYTDPALAGNDDKKDGVDIWTPVALSNGEYKFKLEEAKLKPSAGEGTTYIYLREIDENGYPVTVRIEVGTSALVTENQKILPNSDNKDIGDGSTGALRVESESLYFGTVELAKADSDNLTSTEDNSGKLYYINGNGGQQEDTVYKTTATPGAYAEGLYFEISPALVADEAKLKASFPNVKEVTNNKGEKVYEVRVTEPTFIIGPDQGLLADTTINATVKSEHFTYDGNDFKLGEIAYNVVSGGAVKAKYVNFLGEINAADTEEDAKKVIETPHFAEAIGMPQAVIEVYRTKLTDPTGLLSKERAADLLYSIMPTGGFDTAAELKDTLSYIIALQELLQIAEDPDNKPIIDNLSTSDKASLKAIAEIATDLLDDTSHDDNLAANAKELYDVGLTFYNILSGVKFDMVTLTVRSNMIDYVTLGKSAGTEPGDLVGDTLFGQKAIKAPGVMATTFAGIGTFASGALDNVTLYDSKTSVVRKNSTATVTISNQSERDGYSFKAINSAGNDITDQFATVGNNFVFTTAPMAASEAVTIIFEKTIYNVTVPVVEGVTVKDSAGEVVTGKTTADPVTLQVKHGDNLTLKLEVEDGYIIPDGTKVTYKPVGSPEATVTVNPDGTFTIPNIKVDIEIKGVNISPLSTGALKDQANKIRTKYPRDNYTPATWTELDKVLDEIAGLAADATEEELQALSDELLAVTAALIPQYEITPSTLIEVKDLRVAQPSNKGDIDTAFEADTVKYLQDGVVVVTKGGVPKYYVQDGFNVAVGATPLYKAQLAEAGKVLTGVTYNMAPSVNDKDAILADGNGAVIPSVTGKVSGLNPVSETVSGSVTAPGIAEGEGTGKEDIESIPVYTLPDMTANVPTGKVPVKVTATVKAGDEELEITIEIKGKDGEIPVLVGYVGDTPVTIVPLVDADGLYNPSNNTITVPGKLLDDIIDLFNKGDNVPKLVVDESTTVSGVVVAAKLDADGNPTEEEDVEVADDNANKGTATVPVFEITPERGTHTVSVTVDPNTADKVEVQLPTLSEDDLQKLANDEAITFPTTGGSIKAEISSEGDITSITVDPGVDVDFTVTFNTDITDPDYGKAKITWKADDKKVHEVDADFKKNIYDMSLTTNATENKGTVGISGDLADDRKITDSEDAVLVITPADQDVMVDLDARITIKVGSIQGSAPINITDTLRNFIAGKHDGVTGSGNSGGVTITIDNVKGPVTVVANDVFKNDGSDDVDKADIIEALKELKDSIDLANAIKDKNNGGQGIFNTNDPSWPAFVEDLTDAADELYDKFAKAPGSDQLKTAIENAATTQELIDLVNELLDQDEFLTPTKVIDFINDAKEELDDAVFALKLKDDNNVIVHPAFTLEVTVDSGFDLSKSVPAVKAPADGGIVNDSDNLVISGIRLLPNKAVDVVTLTITHPVTKAVSKQEVSVGNVDADGSLIISGKDIRDILTANGKPYGVITEISISTRQGQVDTNAFNPSEDNVSTDAGIEGVPVFNLNETDQEEVVLDEDGIKIKGIQPEEDFNFAGVLVKVADEDGNVKVVFIPTDENNTTPDTTTEDAPYTFEVSAEELANAVRDALGLDDSVSLDDYTVTDVKVVTDGVEVADNAAADAGAGIIAGLAVEESDKGILGEGNGLTIIDVTPEPAYEVDEVVVRVVDPVTGETFDVSIPVTNAPITEVTAYEIDPTTGKATGEPITIPVTKGASYDATEGNITVPKDVLADLVDYLTGDVDGTTPVENSGDGVITKVKVNGKRNGHKLPTDNVADGGTSIPLDAKVGTITADPASPDYTDKAIEAGEDLVIGEIKPIAGFEPESVQLTFTNPMTGKEITVTIPAELEPGDVELDATYTNERGTEKPLTIMVNIPKEIETDGNSTSGYTIAIPNDTLETILEAAVEAAVTGEFGAGVYAGIAGDNPVDTDITKVVVNAVSGESVILVPKEAILGKGFDTDSTPTVTVEGRPNNTILVDPDNVDGDIAGTGVETEPGFVFESIEITLSSANGDTAVFELPRDNNLDKIMVHVTTKDGTESEKEIDITSFPDITVAEVAGKENFKIPAELIAEIVREAVGLPAEITKIEVVADRIGYALPEAASVGDILTKTNPEDGSDGVLNSNPDYIDFADDLIIDNIPLDAEGELKSVTLTVKDAEGIEHSVTISISTVGVVNEEATDTTDRNPKRKITIPADVLNNAIEEALGNTDADITAITVNINLNGWLLPTAEEATVRNSDGITGLVFRGTATGDQPAEYSQAEIRNGKIVGDETKVFVANDDNFFIEIEYAKDDYPVTNPSNTTNPIYHTFDGLSFGTGVDAVVLTAKELKDAGVIDYVKGGDPLYDVYTPSGIISVDVDKLVGYYESKEHGAFPGFDKMTVLSRPQNNQYTSFVKDYEALTALDEDDVIVLGSSERKEYEDLVAKLLAQFENGESDSLSTDNRKHLGDKEEELQELQDKIDERRTAEKVRAEIEALYDQVENDMPDGTSIDDVIAIIEGEDALSNLLQLLEEKPELRALIDTITTPVGSVDGKYTGLNDNQKDIIDELYDDEDPADKAPSEKLDDLKKLVEAISNAEKPKEDIGDIVGDLAKYPVPVISPKLDSFANDLANNVDAKNPSTTLLERIELLHEVEEEVAVARAKYDALPDKTNTQATEQLIIIATVESLIEQQYENLAKVFAKDYLTTDPSKKAQFVSGGNGTSDQSVNGVKGGDKTVWDLIDPAKKAYDKLPSDAERDAVDALFHGPTVPELHTDVSSWEAIKDKILKALDTSDAGSDTTDYLVKADLAIEDYNNPEKDVNKWVDIVVGLEDDYEWLTEVPNTHYKDLLNEALKNKNDSHPEGGSTYPELLAWANELVVTRFIEDNKLDVIDRDSVSNGLPGADGENVFNAKDDWNKLTDDQKAMVNEELIDNCGKSYPVLLAMATPATEEDKTAAMKEINDKYEELLDTPDRDYTDDQKAKLIGERDDALAAIDDARTLQQVNQAKEDGIEALEAVDYVDKSDLKAKIGDAKERLEDLNVQPDETVTHDIPMGEEYWLQEDVDTLLSAIKDAEDVLNNKNSTQDETDVAEGALQAAIEAFENVMQIGERADTSALEALVNTADERLKDVTTKPDVTTTAEIDNGIEYWLEKDAETLEDAIEDAVAVINDKFATQEEVDAAVVTLQGALNAFEDDMQTGIRASDSYRDAAKQEINDKYNDLLDNNYYTEDGKIELENERDAALEAISTVITEADVDNAVEDGIEAMSDVTSYDSPIATEEDKEAARRKIRDKYKLLDAMYLYDDGGIELAAERDEALAAIDEAVTKVAVNEAVAEGIEEMEAVTTSGFKRDFASFLDKNYTDGGSADPDYIDVFDLKLDAINATVSGSALTVTEWAAIVVDIEGIYNVLPTDMQNDENAKLVTGGIDGKGNTYPELLDKAREILSKDFIIRNNLDKIDHSSVEKGLTAQESTSVINAEGEWKGLSLGQQAVINSDLQAQCGKTYPELLEIAKVRKGKESAKNIIQAKYDQLVAANNYSPSQLKELDDEKAKALDAIEDAGTQAAVDVATNAGITAMEAVLYRDPLRDAIAEAETALKEAKENAKSDGTRPADVPLDTEYWLDGDIETLEAAIAAANDVLNNETANKAQLANATTAMKNAISTFDSAMKIGTKVDKSKLEAAIEIAEGMLEIANEKLDDTTPADVPMGEEYWLASDIATFNAAVKVAQAIFADEASTKPQVDSATAALNAAIETFKNTMKVGANKDAYKKQIKDEYAKVLGGNNFTDEGLTKLEEEKDNALAAIDSASTTEDILEAVEAGKVAMAELAVIPPLSSLTLNYSNGKLLIEAGVEVSLYPDFSETATGSTDLKPDTTYYYRYTTTSGKNSLAYGKYETGKIPDKKPGDATITAITETEISILAETGVEYCIDGKWENKKSGSEGTTLVFGSLTSNTPYVIHSRYASTINGFASDVNTQGVTTKASVDAVAPSIATQPKDIATTKGANVTLSVAANISDDGVLSYQWYRSTSPSTSGGTEIVGATSSTYTPPVDVIGDAYYYVKVTNTNDRSTGTKVATTYSNVAKVTVNPVAVKRYPVEGKIEYANGTVPSDATLYINQVNGKVNPLKGDFVVNLIPQGTYDARFVIVDPQSSNKSLTFNTKVTIDKNGNVTYDKFVLASGPVGANITVNNKKLTISLTNGIKALEEKMANAEAAEEIETISEVIKEYGKLTLEEQKQIDSKLIDKLSKKLSKLVATALDVDVDVKGDAAANNETTSNELKQQHALLLDDDDIFKIKDNEMDVSMVIELTAMDVTNDESVENKAKFVSQIEADGGGMQIANVFNLIIEKTTKVTVKSSVEKDDVSTVNTTLVEKLPTPISITLNATVEEAPYYAVMFVKNGKVYYIPCEVTFTPAARAFSAFSARSVATNATVTFKASDFNTSYALVYSEEDPFFVVAAEDTEYTPPAPQPSGGGGGGGGAATQYYNVTIEQPSNGTLKASIAKAASGNKVTITVTAAVGYELDKLLIVTKADGKEVKFTDNGDGTFTYEQPASEVEVKATFRELKEIPEIEDITENADKTGAERFLNMVDHKAYVVGDEKGRFNANANMTRAETAQALYNLLLDEYKVIKGTVSFTDVKAENWYAKAVLTLAELNVITGYEDGSFKPNAAITRAEFVALVTRLTLMQGGSKTFADVPNTHWAYENIRTAFDYGFIEGYPDGTFKPDSNISRAEAVTIINKLLERKPDNQFVDSIADTNKYPDLSKTHWAYYNIMEASYSHEYDKSSGREKWNSLK